MTACTNKARGAVVAALAGVLALGAVPAVALATGSDVSLQFQEPTGAFEDAEVVQVHLGHSTNPDSDEKDENGVYHVDYVKNAPVSLSWVKFKIYNEPTEDLLVIDPVKEPEKYEVSYYERNGEEMGEEVVDPTDAGDYYAVISAISGQYKGSQFAIPFAIDPIDISKLVKVGGELKSFYDAEAKDLFFYIDNGSITGKYDDKDTKLYVGTDIKVTWYKVGDDLKDEYSVDSVVDAGTYRAYVQGLDNYTGSADLNTQTVDVEKLDLKGSTVFIPGIYCDNDNYGEPTDPQWILIDGQLFGSDSAIMGEIKAELNPTDSVDNTWYKPGLYKYDVTAQDANDPNFVPGTTRPVNAYKLSDKLSFTYKGETVQSGYDVFTGDADASFDDNQIVGKDSKDNEYKRANGNLNVMVFDSEGNVVYDTVAGNTSTPWWTQVGKDFTAIYWYDGDGTVGGQLVLPVHVYAEAVDADASAAVLYDVDGDKIKEVVSSIEATYSGDPLDIDVRVKKADGTVVTSGYTVSYYDAEGNQVREIVNAGTYTLKLTSDTYKLSGTTEMTITVKPLDLSAVNVGAIQTRYWDKVGNVTEYLPWMDDFAYNVPALKLTYGEKKVALPDGVRVTILDASGNQIDKIEDEGVYTLRFEARNADAENNYVLPGDVTVTCIKNGWNKDHVSHLRFTDVEWNDYFANAVDLVAKRSLMTGYQGTNLFGADNTLNRGQMAIVLYNMAKFGPGIDESSLKYDETEGYKTGFDDVDGNMYYAKAIAWARQAGVVNGYDETHFGPEDNITREEFAAMIMNYEKKFGDYEQADASVLDDFSDAASITPWAKNAMSWAVANGVVNGTPEGTLIPTCDILRGDAACMVYNYVK